VQRYDRHHRHGCCSQDPESGCSDPATAMFLFIRIRRLDSHRAQIPPTLPSRLTQHPKPNHYPRSAIAPYSPQSLTYVYEKPGKEVSERLDQNNTMGRNGVGAQLGHGVAGDGLIFGTGAADEIKDTVRTW
jgi:hypothetical protein